MIEELKACPKCGIVGKVVSDDPDCGYRKAYMVECDCGEWFGTEAEAIAAWNRRTPDWRALAQELATALGKFVGYTLSGDVYYFSPETHDLLARARKAGLEV